MMKLSAHKSTFIYLFTAVLLAWNAQATELPSSTKSQLHQIIGKLEQAGAQVGIEIDDLGTVQNPQQFPAKSPEKGTPKVLFSYRATQQYMSASNWKLFTAFYALHSDIPGSARDTKIMADGNIDKKGNLGGSLYLVGNGDPSLNIEQLRAAATTLKKRGITQINGDIIGVGRNLAETLNGRYPYGWTLDDALWYYAPTIGTLAINRNQADVFITGGNKAGIPAAVTYSPDLPDLQMRANVMTGNANLAKKSEDDLMHWNRFEDGKFGFSISGEIAPKQRITQGIPLANPELMAAKVLLRELRHAGIAVNGNAKNAASAGTLKNLQTIPAPPLKVLLQRVLKRSDNFYAEMVLRSSVAPASTVAEIRPKMYQLLKDSGINVAGVRMEDGSGLSRYSLISPQATAQLLAAVQKMPPEKGQIFWDSLPIAGVDGTLRNRMKSTFAANNVRAKTGTFSTVCNLSGYVTTRDGHRLAVSFLVNFGPATNTIRAAQNDAFTLLAATNLQ